MKEGLIYDGLEMVSKNSLKIWRNGSCLNLEGWCSGTEMLETLSNYFGL